ncbi:hypothetical protein M440DRAFT_1237197 [Trichoderma longibrachiatum ATCC 18648]|uniref:Uncharacterized protein n=1 Tax=Trichoderma longibrachiatum ATCC 18648 TaxID=983965 RepID=A0A2T4C5M9_TRILO|nr:hypothetical protein M440DRAFT_1237197 [Trichoderma longibrachiatum ATCC 18648]
MLGIKKRSVCEEKGRGGGVGCTVSCFPFAYRNRIAASLEEGERANWGLSVCTCSQLRDLRRPASTIWFGHEETAWGRAGGKFMFESSQCLITLPTVLTPVCFASKGDSRGQRRYKQRHRSGDRSRERLPFSDASRLLGLACHCCQVSEHTSLTVFCVC